MKFQIASGALLQQVSYVDGVIPSNPILPILENFLFEIENGVLSITASDLQTGMVTHTEVDTDDSGSVAIPAKILVETLRNLPDQPINFQVDEETYGIEIDSSSGVYKLAGSNPVDFPEIQTVNNATNVELPGSVLQDAIQNTIFVTSSDDMRPAMMGVYFNLDDDGATFVATDGHRLVKYNRTDVDAGASSNMILPKKALNLLKNTLGAESSVSLSFNDNYSSFSFDNIRMVCRLIDEQFPDYNNAIPPESPYILVIDRQELLNCLKRIRIYANKTTRQVRLKVEGSTLTVSAEDTDFQNEASEELTCEYDGEKMEIGFNAGFLMEILSNIDSNMISIEMAAPNKAGLIIPKTQQENEDLLMLVMPVMLTSYA